MNPTRVFVIDAHTMFRRGITAMFEADGSYQCVGEADNGIEAVRAAPHLRPELVVVDLHLQGPGGAATVAALRPLLPGARYVVLGGEFEAEQARRCLDAGASCLVLKSASWPELVTAMQAAMRGMRLHSPRVAQMLAESAAQRSIGADLTQRERKLLSLMACGLPNREISAQLAIAMPTVKFHVTNILSKLQVENRTAAVMLALRHGLVGLEG